MKFVQTFWTKPGIGNSLMDIRAGWLSPEYHWMSWALSCLQVRKFYTDIELVTDELGKEILINRLQLPYTSVQTSLESSLAKYPPELWSLAKIFSYSIQDKPFVHLDGDVFIFKLFDEAFLQSGLLAQNVEVDIPYYRSMLNEISNRLPFNPFNNVEEKPIYASNAGIFGGHHIEFIQEYCRQAFEFVDKNLQDIAHIPAIKRPLLNFIFEQYLLYYLASRKGITISYFIKEPVTDPAYQDYARLLEIPDVAFIHPVGAYKSREFTCTQMARRLRKEYPEYYFRILDECKKEMQITFKFYHLFENSPSEIYQKILADDSLQLSNPLQQAATNWPLSRAAMDHMFKSQIIQHIPVSETEFYFLANTITDAHSQQLFREIMELEVQRQKLASLLNQPTGLIRYYKEDIHQYNMIANGFDDLTKFYLNKEVVLIGLSRKWDLKSPGIISDKWNEEPGLEQVALWIDAELLQVNEMYLSPVEMIIVSIAEYPAGIQDILLEAKQYFDATEVEKNHGEYKYAISNSIRQLLYSRILCVE